MIDGISLTICLFDMLYRLGDMQDVPDAKCKIVMEYTVRFSGHNMPGYFNDVDEFDDLTQEELEVMGSDYKVWYEEKYIESVLLGEKDV